MKSKTHKTLPNVVRPHAAHAASSATGAGASAPLRARWCRRTAVSLTSIVVANSQAVLDGEV